MAASSHKYVGNYLQDVRQREQQLDSLVYWLQSAEGSRLASACRPVGVEEAGAPNALYSPWESFEPTAIDGLKGTLIDAANRYLWGLG